MFVSFFLVIVYNIVLYVLKIDDFIECVNVKLLIFLFDNKVLDKK